MFKSWYQQFLNANLDVQHYACHSHHYWPDVTFNAVQQYWLDSARLVDDKWDLIFGTVVPQTQQAIAKHLNLANPEQIVFASNTHELLYRVLSCFDGPLTVLSSDSEFHSFSRQMARLAEQPNVVWLQESCTPFANFKARLLQQFAEHHIDVLFLSQVFFNSGLQVTELDELLAQVPAHVTVIIDGYHGFMAVPTDLSRLQQRIFYLAGGYKYAQAGEGCCFMVVPKGCALRPKHTGWFAEFGALADKSDDVVYAEDGMRFAGATMDFSAVYKLRAVLQLFTDNQLTVAAIHQHVQQLQQAFLAQLQALSQPWLTMNNLIYHDLAHHGHFLTFTMADSQQAQRLARHLQQHKIHIDTRNDRVRFGFALYHDLSDLNLQCLEAFAG